MALGERNSLEPRPLYVSAVGGCCLKALAGNVGAGAREGAAWAADQISQEAGGAEPFAAAGACPALLGLVRTGAQPPLSPLLSPCTHARVLPHHKREQLLGTWRCGGLYDTDKQVRS